MGRAILYSGTKNASSWAMRAWLALREAGFEFDEEVVDIRRPQRFANLAAIGRFSPSATIPVLAIDDAVIFDSLAIMEFANDATGGRLLPADPLLRAQARSVIAWQHSGLSDICAKISFESAFYPLKRKLATEEIEERGRLFEFLEQLLRENHGPYLFGQVSLVDLALVPTLVRLIRHDPSSVDWPAVNSWGGLLLARTSVVEWLRDADALPHVWYDDYLVGEATLDLSGSQVDHANHIFA